MLHGMLLTSATATQLTCCELQRAQVLLNTNQCFLGIALLATALQLH